MSSPKHESDTPVLLGLAIAGLITGILMSVTLIAHNSELLTGVGLAGGCLVVFGGGFAMSARGPARAALVVFATIGVGMLAVGGYAMYST